MKLTLTPLFTHLFSVWFLNRHFVFGTIWYFLLSLFGLFMYEFTVWDKNTKSVSFDHYASFLGGFKFIIPKIYSINFSTLFTSDTPNFFQWLPSPRVLSPPVKTRGTSTRTKRVLLKN